MCFIWVADNSHSSQLKNESELLERGFVKFTKAGSERGFGKNGCSRMMRRKGRPVWFWHGGEYVIYPLQAPNSLDLIMTEMP
jgi:hypothetical protein